jgi:glycosyltransferase involved in cell wall biosynthesis
MAPELNNGISIVICCYNSAGLLPETLKHIAQQKVRSAFKWELIIVNNSSQDDTVAVAKKEWSKYLLPQSIFRIAEETNLGLTNARKRGVAEARYEYIIFCDDDNWLDENYLENAWSIMNSNPQVGAAGGRLDAVFEQDPPGWWKEYQHAYAVGKQTEKSGDITFRKYVWGAGMVVRKSLMKLVFNDKIPFVLTDRKGQELSSGGDAEICARLLLLNCKLWYDERLMLYHYMPKSRLTSKYRDELVGGQAAAQNILDEYERVIYFSTLKTPVKIEKTLEYFKLRALGHLNCKSDRYKLKANISCMWARNFWNLEGLPIRHFRVRNYLVSKKKIPSF